MSANPNLPAAQPQPPSHDELMLNCLRCEDFDKSRAIKMYIDQFPASEHHWVKTYAYKVYERVLEKLPTASRAGISLNQTLLLLDRAEQKAFQQACQTQDWGPYVEIVKRKEKVLGLDKGDKGGNALILAQQNNNNFGNMSYEDIMNDINRLSSKLNLPNQFPGAAPTISIPANAGANPPGAAVTAGYPIQGLPAQA